MSGEKPVREMGSILIRVPDGLKERIAQRAKANDRSMNAEIVAIITHVLDAPDEMGLRALREEQRRIYREIEAVNEHLAMLQMRRESIRAEMRARLPRGEDID